MSVARTLAGCWIVPAGRVTGDVVFDRRVRSIPYGPAARPGSPGAGQIPLFLPAPIDLHVHGAGGADVMGGEQALRRVLAVQGSLGCGALLATSVCAPFEAIDAFLADIAAVMAQPDTGSATLLGAHLEGPFVNPEKLGAQPPYATAFDPAVLERWLATGVVRVVTFAPEMDERQRLPTLCAAHGARAQIGHTLCDHACAAAALAAGCGVTHLWNAMSGVAHRDGGAALAALARASHAEIIADGQHVDRAAFDAARRAIPCLYCVTDGTAAVGMPDGTYRLGSHDVTRSGDRVTLPDGTLAGSCLDPIGLLRVLRDWTLEWEEIALRTATYPADWIGAAEWGRVAPGARCHWLELDGERPVALWRDGERGSLESAGTMSPSPSPSPSPSEPEPVQGTTASRLTGPASPTPTPSTASVATGGLDDTERTSVGAPALDTLTSADVVALIVAGQRRAVDAVGDAGATLAAAVEAAAERLAGGRGRLVLLGAGASGRIAVQDGAELWPTFGWPANRLVLAMAGGEAALLHSVEGAEDDAEAARTEVDRLGIAADDVVVAVAASGRSPWTVAWATRARERGALSVAFANNAGTPLLASVEHPVLLASGAEVLAGSTRMGAGTAQKAALNAFGTTLMVRLNRTWGNLMVDMAARNVKLDGRRLAMLREIVPDADEAAARVALAAADGSVKLAALLALGDTPPRARARLARAAGSLRQAIVSFESDPP